MPNKGAFTLEQIVDDLLKNLHASDRDYISGLTRDQLGTLHHGFGTHIRNEYLLWHESPLTEKWRTNEAGRDIRDGVDHSADHPDSVSMQVIEKLWERLKSVESVDE